jgi:hypothetical protein
VAKTSEQNQSTTEPNRDVVNLYRRYMREHNGELDPIQWGEFAWWDGRRVGTRVAYHTMLTFADLVPTLQEHARHARLLVRLFSGCQCQEEQDS